jgi:anti-sigma28 factor (negative regulator of flagellin synthesis)
MQALFDISHAADRLLAEQQQQRAAAAGDDDRNSIGADDASHLKVLSPDTDGVKLEAVAALKRAISVGMDPPAGACECLSGLGLG